MENEGKLKGIFLMKRGIAPFTRFVKSKCMYNIRLNEYTEYELKELTRLRVLHRRFHQQENPCLPVSLPFVQNVRNLMTVMQFFPLFVTVSTRGVTKSLVATSADSVPSSYLVRITIAPIGTTFGNLQ